jgi:hypothetical protein
MERVWRILKQDTYEIYAKGVKEEREIPVRKALSGTRFESGL